MTDIRQIEKRTLPRWIAVACILIALLFAGLEATHIHGAARSGGAGGPCAVCISAHANAPLVAPQSLPLILTVAILVVPCDVNVKGVPAERTLFIRPPPSA